MQVESLQILKKQNKIKTEVADNPVNKIRLKQVTDTGVSVLLSYIHSKRTSQINVRQLLRHTSEKVERSVDLPARTCLHTDSRLRNALRDAERRHLRHQDTL